jgi:hypothetical protein
MALADTVQNPTDSLKVSPRMVARDPGSFSPLQPRKWGTTNLYPRAAEKNLQVPWQ